MNICQNLNKNHALKYSQYLKLKNCFYSLVFLAGACVSKGKPSAQKTLSAKKTGSNITFDKKLLTNEFLAEGVAVGDVNRDGKMDVMAGSYWFEAPHWQKHELTKPEKFFYDKGYSNAFVSQAMDVNLDGWIDFVRIGFPGKEALWFENPGKRVGHWPVHTIQEAVGNESAGFYDVNGDGRLDLLGGNATNKQMNWFRAPVSKKDTSWQQFTISKERSFGAEPFSHGLGLSDINKDGRRDVIIKEGWWEAPANPVQPDWVFHPANLGEACAQMYGYDFDSDGDQDVVSSSAHQLGIWWHEQIPTESGNTQWKTHLIADKFTQTHGLAFVDINSDGHPDLVTGKRYFAHMGRDPGEFDPAVLYWFEFVPGKNPAWVPHLIDDNSGAGVHVVAEDMNKDKFIDVVIANKKGVFVFEQKRR